MTSIDSHKKDYAAELCIDCPFCGADRPEHRCAQCYDDKHNRKTCWSTKGFCSTKCGERYNEEIEYDRKIIIKKESMGIKCRCNDSSCAKCLNTNCKDEDCPTHSVAMKSRRRL